MHRQSGKVQLLFWLFVVSVILYLSILWTAVSTFLFGSVGVELPEGKIAMLYIFYAFLVLTTLAGTTLAIMINNRRYTNRFGAMVILIFVTFLAGKSVFG